MGKVATPWRRQPGNTALGVTFKVVRAVTSSDERATEVLDP
jgi:hypothetical protein